MQDLLIFAQHHWELSLALVLAVFVLIIIEMMRVKRGAARLSPAAVTQLLNHQHATAIDLRSKDAYANGHITGSISMPLKEIETQTKKLAKYKSAPIILVCANGTTSPRAAALLAKEGFQVNVLQGGIQGWVTADMPLVKK